MKSELGFVIVTHGRLGEEMLGVAQHILGKKLGRFVSIQIPFSGAMIDIKNKAAGTPHRDRRKWLEQQVAKAATQVDSGAGVVIFTDIIGGTAFNVAQHLLANGRTAVVTGVNLPMLLKVPSVKELSPHAAALELVARSRRAIDFR